MIQDSLSKHPHPIPGVFGMVAKNLPVQSKTQRNWHKGTVKGAQLPENPQGFIPFVLGLEFWVSAGREGQLCQCLLHQSQNPRMVWVGKLKAHPISDTFHSPGCCSLVLGWGSRILGDLGAP